MILHVYMNNYELEYNIYIHIIGVIPQETPVNQKTNQKSVPYKMPAPSFISRHRYIHSM